MKVFISHAFDDLDLAKRIGDRLKTAGFQVWDQSLILPGDNWGEQAGRALQDSDAMVVLLTPSSIRSINVTREIDYALGKKVYKGRVVPVLAAPPDALPADQIPWVLGKFHLINLADTEPEEGFKQIAKTLQDAA